MNKQASYSNHGIVPLVLIVVVVLVLSALFSGKRTDDSESDFQAGGSMQNGVFVNREWFSVEVTQINRRTSRKYNIPPGTKGVIITELGGNRDVMMKLRKGDVIKGINSRKIDNLRDFRKGRKDVNPTEGMFLDIQRSGYPLYVSVSGSGAVSNGQASGYRNPHPFSMTEIAPFSGRDFNIGGINTQAGILGKPVEKWIAGNFGGGFLACSKCGTLIPDNGSVKPRSVLCPNCGNKMVRK